MGILDRFPASWRTSVTVLRDGGRDAKGNPQPVVEIERPDVLVGARSTADPLDRSDVVDATASLYDDDPSFTYEPTDRVRVPEGALMAGVWAVDGRPGRWPFGVEVGLVRA